MKTRYVVFGFVLFFVIRITGLQAEPSQILKSLHFIQKTSDDVLSPNFRTFIDTIERIESKSEIGGQRIWRSQPAETTWEMTTQLWINNAWQDKYRDIMVFDDMHDELINNLTYEWKNGAWVEHSRMTAQLDANGNLTSMTLQTWTNEKWITDMKTSYEYNAAGDVTVTTIQTDTNGDGTLENMSKTECAYDSNGFLIEDKTFMDDYGTWTEMQKTVHANNAQGLPIESISKMHLGGGEYMDTGKSTFTYDASGNLLVQTEYTANFMTQTWLEQDRTTYTYNAAGQETSMLDETWDGATWVNERQMTITYDGQGRETETLYQVWNGAWVNEERSANTLDASGQVTETLFQEWNGSWQNRERWLYSTSGPVFVNDAIQTPEHFSLCNYPNPFNPSTTLAFTLQTPQHISLHIYNSSGELISIVLNDQLLSSGEHNILWNGRNMRNQSVSSGVYFIKLFGDSFSQTTRALLIK